LCQFIDKNNLKVHYSNTTHPTSNSCMSYDRVALALRHNTAIIILTIIINHFYIQIFVRSGTSWA